MAKQNQYFYTLKFNSARLKLGKYNINVTIDDARKYGELIQLFDSQMLRSLRRISNHPYSEEELAKLREEEKDLLLGDQTEKNIELLKEKRKEIDSLLFIPDYITVKMDAVSHYKRIFKKGLVVNGKKFKRFSVSAGQARLSTITMVSEDYVDKLDEILNNGRNLSQKLVPAKLNAYKGVYGSGTLPVSDANFCVVPDYFSKTTSNVDFVTVTGMQEEDKIERKTIEQEFNRFDGMGLISPKKAAEWAEELGLDYVPSQFCVRNSYLKGMVCVFDFHKFAERDEVSSFDIKTVYKDENGKHVYKDIREMDLVISESMLKMWSSYPSIESYIENCKKNQLNWGISLYSPKKDKDILRMNYQFLQTLDLNKQDIEEVCKMFVDWISGVTSDNFYYTILFLMGNDVDEKRFIREINSGKKHWLRALILNPKMIHDKYIKNKVYDLIKNKINKACMGQIYVEGNFQTLVSDPYAMCEHIFGLPVKGLLKKDEHFSQYWNRKGITTVDSMRAPLTYRSEHVLLNLQNNDDLQEWFGHLDSGVIVNVHGNETNRWAGADFDFDIIATTSNKTIVKGVYKNEVPIVYKEPSSTKVKITEESLFNADLFSFGSQIGQITNKSTSAFALLANFEKDSEEYKMTLERIKSCTVKQSAQIDKAKIGQEVKGIPNDIWTKYQKIQEDDSEEIKKQKEFNNRILLDKHPYFFIYLYSDTKKKYQQHFKKYDMSCQQKFGIKLSELLEHKTKTIEQIEFIKMFEEYSPVIHSNCVMNNICRHIESIDFQIKDKLKKDYIDFKEDMMNDSNLMIDNLIYEKLKNIYKDYRENVNQLSSEGRKYARNGYDENLGKQIDGQKELLKQNLQSVIANEKLLTDYMITMFYEDNSLNKDLLWSLFGDVIVKNIKDKTNSIVIPVEDENGEIKYLDKRYSLKEMAV